MAAVGAVVNVFVDPRANSAGAGTELEPFASLALADAGTPKTPGSTIRLFLQSGTTCYEKVPRGLSSTDQVALELAVYGGSELANVDATQPVGQWSVDAASGVFRAALGTFDAGDVEGHLTIGALLENGECLPMRVWNPDPVQLADSLAGGAYTYDWETGVVYMLPREGMDPSRNVYRVAVHSYVMEIDAPGPWWIGRYGDEYRWNKSLQGIRLVGAKRHAFMLSATKTRLEQCAFYAVGGQQFDEGLYLGNAIEAAITARVLHVRGCDFDQIFDSGLTAQTYGDGQIADEVLVEWCNLARCGLWGLEFSVQDSGTMGTTRSITGRHNTIRNARGSFAPEIYSGRYGGIGVINNAAGVLDRLALSWNDIDGVDGGIYVSRSGERVQVVHNLLRRCATSALSTSVEGEVPTTVSFRRNDIADSNIGLKTRHSSALARTEYEGNEVHGCRVGYRDESTAPARVSFKGDDISGNDVDFELEGAAVIEGL